MSAGGSRTPVAARRLWFVAGAAGAVVASGFLFDPRRALGGWLLGFLTLTALALAGLLFLALLRVAGARWADELLAVPRAMGAALPLAFVAGLVMLPGLPLLYAWARGGAPDPVLARKAAWLNVPGFSLRLIVCFAVWLVLARVLRRRTFGVGAAAGFIAAFAVTWSVASVDWVESLEPHWFSTIFALRTATSLVASGLAAATILVILQRDRRPLRGRVSTDHLHDLGRLTLSFSILWVYIWFCQYLLIWYCDLPEEAAYYARRAGGWHVLTIASLGLAFALPFFVLLLRSSRRSAPILLRLSFVVLAGQALDLVTMVGPGTSGGGPALGLLEIAGLLAGFTAFFAAALAALHARAPEELLAAEAHPTCEGNEA